MTTTQKNGRNIISLVLTVAVICLMAAAMIPGAMGIVATAPTLNGVANFSILAGSAITGAGSSIYGDIGLYPAAGSSIGVACADMKSGNVYDRDGTYLGGACLVTDDPLLANAVGDRLTAYNSITAAGQPGGTLLASGEIGGMTFAPGLYTSPVGITITNDVTLDAAGDPTAVWVFQSPSTLALAASKKVILSGGALPENVFWQVDTSTTLGSSSVMNGNIFGRTTIAFDTSAKLNGRATTATDVTLLTNTVTRPDLMGAAPVAAFTTVPSPATGPAPLVITFTDTSTPGAGLTSWIWEFGDGNTSILQNPVNTYPIGGPYGVNLTVIDANAISSSYNVTNAVTIAAAPVFVSAETNTAGTVVIVSFDKLMLLPGGNVGQFTYKNATGVQTFSAAALNATTSKIDLTPTTVITPGDLINVSYIPGTVTAADLGVLAAFTDQPITNNVPSAPVFVSAATNAAGTVVIVSFDKLMLLPGGNVGQFTYKNATGVQTFSAAALNATTSKIDLTPTTVITPGDLINVSYIPGTVTAADLSVLAAFTDQPITNNVPAAPVFVSAATNTAGTVVIVSFNKAMADPSADAAQFTYKNATGVQTFSAAALNATTSKIDLTPTTVITPGDLINVSYIPGSVTAADLTVLAAFTDQPITNNVPAAPVFVSAATNAAGTVVIVSFDKAMADPSADAAQFTYRNATGVQTFSAAALNATTSKIDLTPTTVITPGDLINVSYIPGSVTAADLTVLAAFTDQPITNNVPSAPVFVSAATNAAGTVVIVSFDKAMADPSADAAQFTYRNATGVQTFSAAALNATTSKIDLTPTTVITPGDLINVSYIPGSVTAADLTVLAAFTDQPVTNNALAAAPTFGSILPVSGPTAGSTTVVITGTNFVAGGSFGVTIGGLTATDITWNSATQITAKTPANTAGLKNVVITNNDGQTVTGVNAYTYVAPPTFTSITPISGPLAGNDIVTIVGTNFVNLGQFNVTFGGVNATSVTWNSATSITASTPSGTAGAKDVVIINNDSQTATRVGAYTYATAPNVTSVSPASGSTAGTNTVTILGTDFTGASIVNFGATAGTFTVNSATKITATAPAHAAGLVDVTITTPGGVSATSFADNYTYVSPATGVDLLTAGNYEILAQSGISTTGTTLVTGDMGITPAAASYITGFGLVWDGSSPSSTSTLVTGNVYAPGYGAPTPADLVTAQTDMVTAYNNAQGATPFVNELGDGNIGGLTLAPGVYKWGTGVTIPTDVTLDAQGNSSAVWIFQIAQTLDLAASKHIILSNGAQAKNIFWAVAGTTTLGANSEFNGNILDATNIALITGAKLNGRAQAQTAVTLQSNIVTDPTTIAATPTFTSITVTPGPTAGGNNVTITGTGFTGATLVTFDGIAATNMTVFSATQINATAPGHAAGAVDIVVTTPLGVATGPAAYTYGDVPVFVYAQTNAAGTVITITFNKAMTSPAGKQAEFAYQINGGADQAFSAAVLNSDTTTIDLTTSGAAIASSNLVTVSYTKGTVTAADSGVLASFATQPVTNSMVGGAPVVTAATTNAAGTVITLTFNKAMNDPIINAANFTYKIGGGAAQPFSAVVLNGGSTFDLTTSGTAIALGDVVTISYTTGTVTAVDTGILATFVDRAVTNGIPSPTPVPTPVPTAAPSSEGSSPSGGSEGYGGSSTGGSGLVSNNPAEPGYQYSPGALSSITPVTGTGAVSSNPFTADLPSMPQVTVSWITQINENPDPNAAITTVVQEYADQYTLNAYTTALHLVGKDIGSLAYVMIIQKTGVTSFGPATVTMSASPEWVNQNGGIDAITIVRMADDGTTEALTTTFTGYNLNTGYPTFEAGSVHGLSTFGLVAVKSYTAPAEPYTAPGSGLQSPPQVPVTPTTSTSTETTGMPIMLVGGILAALAIIGIAMMVYIRRNK